MPSSRGIKAGRAYVELGVSDRLTKGLRAAQRRLKAFGAGLRSVGTQFAALGGGVVAPLLGAARVFAGMGDSLNKMSARTGIAVEALSELGFAAEQSGTDLGSLENGLRRMQRSILDGERGLSTAVDAFDELGLAVSDLTELSPEQQFKLLSDRLSQIEDPTRKAALAMMLFGRSGTALLPMMANGAKGIEELQQQARDLGLTISTGAAKDAAVLTDTLNMLWRTLKQAAFAVGAALAPTLTEVADTMTRVVIRVSSWIKENGKLVVAVLAAGTAIAAIGVGAIAAGFAISGLAGLFGALATTVSVAGAVMGAILSPIGLVIAAIAGLGTAAVIYSGAAGDALHWLGEQFGRLKAFVGTVVGGIADALKAGDIGLATKVLWAGVRVAWEKGIAPLRQMWNEFRYAIQRVAIQAFAGLKSAWINVSTWMWTNFPKTTEFVAKTWANLGATLRKVWVRFQDWLSDRWIEVMGLFDESLDVEMAKTIGREDLNEQLSEIERNRAKAVAEAERKGAMTAAEHEAERAAAMAQVELDKAEALARLNADHQERVAAAQEALRAAQEELAAVRAQAREDAAEQRELAKRPQLPGGVGDVGAIGKDMARRISAVGTFNAAAIAGLGGGRQLDRIVTASEQTAKNTKEIVRKPANVFT